MVLAEVQLIAEEIARLQAAQAQQALVCDLYSSSFEAGIWTTRKHSRFKRRKGVHITNMSPFSTFESRGFGLSEISSFEV